MKTTKSWRAQTFGPLRELTMEATALQTAHRRFDFSPESTVARHLVAKTFACLEDHERSRGGARVSPFTVRVDWQGRTVGVELMPPAMLVRLAGEAALAQELRDRREALFKELLQWDPAVTMHDIRCLLAPTALLASRRGGARRADVLPDEHTAEARMDLAELRKVLSVSDTLVPPPEELPPPPAEVVAKVGPVIEGEGRSSEMARSFISHLQVIRQRFCPRLDELVPGQLVAVALDVTDRDMRRPMRHRAHVPVKLTLYDEAELATLERVSTYDHREVDRLLQRRVARLLTEAYCQGGLLSLVLVGVLTHQSASRVARSVNDFETTHRLVLPTPGTIHDAGSKLTHKAAIVRMHLEGMECKDIARQTFHSEQAVGRYVDDFERVLIALGHGLRASLVSRVLRLGAHVVAQYEALIAQHIGGLDDVRALLLRRGVEIEEAVS